MFLLSEIIAVTSKIAKTKETSKKKTKFEFEFLSTFSETFIFDIFLGKMVVVDVV